MTATATLTPVDPALVLALEAVCAEVGTRATDRLAAAHDASHYLLRPHAVATASSADEVAAVMAAAREHSVPVTFRSGGTSLSGQAGSDGVLIDTRKHFRGITVLDDAASVRVQPGATVRAVNTRLARYKRKLGPDPASEIACTIGGVIANNSSGMSCGTHANTYRTLESAVLVLPSGTVIDTGAADADKQLAEREPALHAGLIELRDRVRANPDSMQRIAQLYAIKNTMGYGLNSLVDFDEPVRILQQLVIGSEGTLAFVAEATFRTLPVPTDLATGLLIFASLAEATAALPALVEAGFATIELLDAASLRVAQQDPDATAELTSLHVADHAALLVEFHEHNAADLQRRREQASGVFAALPLVTPTTLTDDPATRAQLWHIRKGLYTAVAGARPSGTTALLEDIAVPVERLGYTCSQLIELFARHDYEGSVIFGHAKDGNIHFLINERFDDPANLARYEAFTEDMVNLVLGQGGTLKAEHGTGRIMAPYVNRQVGDELYDVMWQIKKLIDPQLQLNPGVLLTHDPAAHVHNLKSAPTVEEEVDRCVECGYCEPVCPSRNITLTPRERIVLRREMQAATDRGDTELARTLQKEYDYDGVQTCAVDGMCQTACPVLINTGDLVRRLRAENQNGLAQAGWKTAARHWSGVTSLGGTALSAAKALPTPLTRAATTVGRAVLGADTVPQYADDLPAGGSKRRVINQPDAAAVYFSSCTTTMFGPVGDDGVAESFVRLCERAGIALTTPDTIASLCCGTPWKSKGLTDGYALMQQRVTEALITATDNGRLPVVCDASSCTEGLLVLLEPARERGIRVIDAVEFVATTVLPLLPEGNKVSSLTLHPTCSSTQLGINDALQNVAAAAADTVVVPENWGCCAFAGDRGMLHPELTASATEGEAADVRAAASAVHASCNRTCELGMTRATGYEYEHVLQVLDRATAGSAPREH
ncbi:FAD-binding and (Fe-S)-binding domain-containing protein [Microbacterium sp. YY-01]|uniref:FAD-binding and (Fe-S)-binding domain-containing protein n=1 Tax=Microbacterium sp. YY-01 TaxID=3421634 RepID=UPI003D17E04E